MKSRRILTSKMIDMNSVFIPERFYKEIALHIFKNHHANKDQTFKTPLILAISGAPGMGKTYQTEYVLDDLGVEKFTISGAEFEHEHAGVPVKNIRNIYKNISDDIFYKKFDKGAIIIDDIDAAIGEWGGLVQYTMNRQLLIKALIDFADNPFLISAYDDDEQLQQYQTCRVPLIVTLNDETKMYEPLMRNGRTRIFPWIPQQDEITHILDEIFKEISIDKPTYYLYTELLSYVNAEIDPNAKSIPISLFSDICSSVYDNYIWDNILSHKPFNEISNELSRLCSKKTSYKCSDLFDIGKKLLNKNKNYLNRNENK